MAFIDPEIPSEFPDGYIPFYLRVNMGEWWNFDNTSNFWCCDSGGINMEMWFYLDMYFLMYIFWEFAQDFSCPIDAETNFWIWEDCVEYDHTAFQFNLTSIVTDSGTGESVMTGGQYKEMILTIAANSETYEPYIWMRSGNGMCFTTDNFSDSEIRFFSTDPLINVDPGDAYYFGFGISTPTPGIMDSVIDAAPMSSPTPYDRNIYLKPSLHGLVKFGIYQSCPTTVTITGFITMVDETGKVINLAVIDYSGQMQEHYQPM